MRIFILTTSQTADHFSALLEYTGKFEVREIYETAAIPDQVDQAAMYLEKVEAPVTLVTKRYGVSGVLNDMLKHRKDSGELAHVKLVEDLAGVARLAEKDLEQSVRRWRRRSEDLLVKFRAGAVVRDHFRKQVSL